MKLILNKLYRGMIFLKFRNGYWSGLKPTLLIYMLIAGIIYAFERPRFFNEWTALVLALALIQYLITKPYKIGEKWRYENGEVQKEFLNKVSNAKPIF